MVKQHENKDYETVLLAFRIILEESTTQTLSVLKSSGQCVSSEEKNFGELFASTLE